MDKKIILILVSFLLLIGGQQCAEEVTIGTAFVGGSQGLVLDFIEGAPPDEIFDQGKTPFSVNVKVENKGEWDVDENDAAITISGINPAVFDNPDLSKDLNVDLQGTEKDVQGNIIPGTITYLNFPGFNYMNTITGSVDLTIKADVCYEYGTNVNSKLCVLKDLLGRVAGATSPVCIVNEAKAVENSGAPVKVMELKERAIESDKIMFTFIVQHVGTGYISELNSDCDSGLDKKDKVNVGVDTGIPGDLSCTFDDGTGSEGTVTLYGGQRLVTCTQTKTDNADYEQLIKIELEYDCQDSITTPLKISHTG